MDKYILNIYTNNDILYKFMYNIKILIGSIIPNKNNETILFNILKKKNTYGKKGIIFVTHNNLSPIYSAFQTLTKSQKIYWGVILTTFLLSFIAKPIITLVSITGILTSIYFIDFLFTLLVIIRSFGKKAEIKFTKEELVEIDDRTLPKYTILCPLYKEWEVIEQFSRAIEIIDWPKDRLEVILLLEEDDTRTINRAYELKLPSYFKIEIVPDSLPKTKPKACNYGLIKATGEFIVVYDAEDKPDPLQLKKAYLAFQRVSERTVCLQSKLNYYNQDQNILTRLFTSEYSYWFDIALPGLQTLNTIIPLSGTSNHFKTSVLKQLQGWDPFNVTEDCDLGTRLFKEGFRTAIIDSQTLEEANSNLKSWLRQRSRWIKGYMQTYLVHMRNPIEFILKYKHHALLFQLIIGMRMVFMIINPILWLMTIAYFTMYPIFGPFIESLYPWYIFYPAVFCLVFANFTYFYSYMIASAKKDKWELIQYIFLIPFYWVMTSVSAGIAFYQLITKPYYWEKTQHGLHLGQEEKKVKLRILWKRPSITIIPSFEFPKLKIFGEICDKIYSFIRKDRNAYLSKQKGEKVVYESRSFLKIYKIGKLLQSITLGGGILIGANLFANFSNYLFNAILGRSLSYEDFGSTSLVTNLQLLLQVTTGALFATVSYKSAILLGRRGGIKKDFWRKIRKYAFFIFLPVSLVFLIFSYFNTHEFNSLIVTLAVSLSLLFSAVSAVDGGFLSGNLKFVYLASLVALAPVVKFATGYFGLLINNLSVIYFSQTVATLVSLLIGWVLILRMKEESTIRSVKEKTDFPKKFYITSVMNRFSVAFFLSADVIMAKIFLTGTEAGKYAILSLVGKTIYFLGSLIPQFITPIIGKEIGEGKNGLKTFYRIFPLTIAVVVSVFVMLGVYPKVFAVKLFGDKVYGILPYIFQYSFAISAFTIASTIALYHQTRKQYIFSYLGFLLSFFEIIYLIIFHDNIEAFVHSIYQITFSYITGAVVLHFVIIKRTSLTVNIISFMKLFTKTRVSLPLKDKQNILIFNWRDTKHKWQGGAEVYVQEIAQKWVKKGYGVTIFCSNDGDSRYNGKVNGVCVIRRGGFFTLYIWAAVYYLLKLRNKFDFIIDCENGIPFFTPLFSSLPKVLLIHHVHQQVFRENLPYPAAILAVFLESKVMKYVYRNTKIVTISESSKVDIEDLGLFTSGDLDIVNPGINLRNYARMNKYNVPTFSYLGRLMPYKNIDILINAFEDVLKNLPEAKLIIAGKGPVELKLRDLTKKLGIEASVDFKGYVNEDEKRQILGKSWIMIQPSSFEGWGITVIEANAGGTPVIASDTTGLRDSVVDGQTGLLVKTGDVKELARMMLALSEMDGYRNRLSKNAYKWSRNFSWNDSADKLLNIVAREIEKSEKLSVPQLAYIEE